MTDKKSKASNPSVNRRSMARYWAVSALYQMEASHARLPEIIREFIADRLSSPLIGPEGDETLELLPTDKSFFVDLTEGVVRRQLIIDRRIQLALQAGWPLARLDAVLRAALRVATYEIIARKDVPARVVINEYIEIAKSFFEDGAEVKMLNGVLDKLAHDARTFEFTPAMESPDKEVIDPADSAPQKDEGHEKSN